MKYHTYAICGDETYYHIASSDKLCTLLSVTGKLSRCCDDKSIIFMSLDRIVENAKSVTDFVEDHLFT